MDSRLKYRQTVKALLQEYAQFLDDEQSNLRLLFDDERETYLLLDFGWRDQRYVHGSILHVELRDDKIWIQCDYTEDGIAPELADMGIPKQKIVLGFREPNLRPYTGFGVG